MIILPSPTSYPKKKATYSTKPKTLISSPKIQKQAPKNNPKRQIQTITIPFILWQEKNPQTFTTDVLD